MFFRRYPYLDDDECEKRDIVESAPSIILPLKIKNGSRCQICGTTIIEGTEERCLINVFEELEWRVVPPGYPRTCESCEGRIANAPQ